MIEEILSFETEIRRCTPQSTVSLGKKSLGFLKEVDWSGLVVFASGFSQAIDRFGV